MKVKDIKNYLIREYKHAMFVEKKYELENSKNFDEAQTCRMTLQAALLRTALLTISELTDIQQTSIEHAKEIYQTSRASERFMESMHKIDEDRKVREIEHLKETL